MNCNDCIKWMKTRTGQGLHENPEVMTHLQSCPECRQIFALDTCLEAGIQQAFTAHRLPAGLAESIDACVNRYTGVHQKMELPDTDPVSLTKTETPGLSKRNTGKKDGENFFQN